MAMNRTTLDEPAVTLFHSLADPMRLTIIRLLADGERRVVDLTGELGLAQSTVSGHLACLRAAGLVDAHPHGRSTYYALNHAAELWPLLAAAERLLDASGTELTLCPEHHRPAPVAECGVAIRGCMLHGGHPDGLARDGHDSRDGRAHDARTHDTHDGRVSDSHDGRAHDAAGHQGPRPAGPNRPGRH